MVRIEFLDRPHAFCVLPTDEDELGVRTAAERVKPSLHLLCSKVQASLRAQGQQAPPVSDSSFQTFFFDSYPDVPFLPPHCVRIFAISFITRSCTEGGRPNRAAWFGCRLFCSGLWHGLRFRRQELC